MRFTPFVSGAIAAVLATAAPPASGQPPAKPPAADPLREAHPKLADLVDALKTPVDIPQDPARMKALRASHLKWYLDTTVGAFNTVGDTKAPWAEKARAALTARAEQLAVLPGIMAVECGHAKAAAAVRAAVAAGCDDPLVLYYALRIDMTEGRVAPGDLIPRFRPIAARMYASKYPDLRKMHVVYNYYNNLAAAPPDARQGADEVDTWRARAWEVYDRVAAIDERDVQHEILEIAGLWETRDLRRGGDRTRSQNYDELADHLTKAKAPEYTRLVAKGRYDIHRAWDARGSGFAGTVTEDGWKAFYAHLTDAAEALEAAAKLAPDRREAPTEMLTVCKGLGAPRAEMNKWFRRAMTADPDNCGACLRYLEALDPRWGGTPEEFAAFSFQCVRTRNVHGYLTLVPVSINAGYVDFLGPQSFPPYDDVLAHYRTDYTWYACHLGLTAYLQSVPDDRWWRSVHARLACYCGQDDVSEKEFEKLGDKYSTAVFRTKAEYDAFRKWSKTTIIPERDKPTD